MNELVRIRPPAEHVDLIEDLVGQGVFESKAAALVFCAAYGAREGLSRKLNRGGEGIRWEIFERSNDSTFISCLALVKTERFSGSSLIHLSSSSCSPGLMIPLIFLAISSAI